ncbi:MAG: hypothetical protein ACI9Z3_002014, partial [Roseivirga sp.]
SLKEEIFETPIVILNISLSQSSLLIISKC